MNDHAHEEKKPAATVGQKTNAWVQSVAIIAAGLWGAYTFVYKEIFIPSSAPINLTTQLSLKEVGVGAGRSDPKFGRLAAIELHVSATNPSTRTVYLLSNIWTAQGLTVSSQENPKWLDGANEILANPNPTSAGRSFAVASSVPVASGRLFGDDRLKPQETITRSIIFYVPQNAYDQLFVQATIPNASKCNAAEIAWTLDDQGQALPRAYRLQAKPPSLWERIFPPADYCPKPIGKKELETDETGAYAAGDINLQMAASSRELSLWRPRKAEKGEEAD